MVNMETDKVCKRQRGEQSGEKGEEGDQNKARN